MEEYQQRVVEEKNALDEKIQSLEAFMTEDNETFAALPVAEKTRMAHQRDHMEAYSRVLGDRISNFPQE